MKSSRSFVFRKKSDLKVAPKEDTVLPDDSETRRKLVMALSNTSEAKSWPPIALYSSQAYWYTRSPWVYLAVTQIARTAALVKLNAFKLDGEQKVAQINHPLEMLLRKPNPWQSRFELIEQTIGYQQITGNAYWFLYSESGGEPDEIILLRPDRVKIVAGEDSSHLISGYVYYVEGMEIPIEPQEVIHFKRFHPLSDYYGLSPLEALAADVQGDAAMAEFNRNFYSKDMAIPAGVVNIKNPISVTEFERIKAEWRESYGGRNRRTAFLQASEVEYQDIGLSHKDSDFLNGRQFSKEEILMVYGVPPGMLDKSSTEANATTALEFFTDHTVWPIMTELCQKISSDLAPFYGADLVVEPEDIRPKDAEAERTELQAYGPYLTINEIRARYLNLPPVAWGDQPATGGGTLLAPSALQGINGQSNSAASLEKNAGDAPTRTDSGSAKPTPQGKQSVPMRQHDIGRTREATREVTRYAKFVLKRAGTEREDDIDDFKFNVLPEREAAGLKAIVDINPQYARWMIDEPYTPLRASESWLHQMFRESQLRMAEWADVKFTNQDEIWVRHHEQESELYYNSVKSVIQGARNQAIDYLALLTGYDANFGPSDANLKAMADRWLNTIYSFFVFETQQSLKSVSDPTLLAYSPLFDEPRVRQAVRIAAAKLEEFGTALGVRDFAKAYDYSTPIFYPDGGAPEYRIIPVVEDMTLSVKWEPLMNNPVGHIRGHPLPKSESTRVEAFSPSDIEHYFTEYGKYNRGQ